jgi:hypothetical protein
MRKDKLGKLYDRFDPEERFRLVLKAAARGDEEDIERLRNTCPRATYTAIDIAFSGRVNGSRMMTMMLIQLLTPSLTKLQTLAAFRKDLSYAFDHCINESRFSFLLNDLEGQERRAASEALVIWQAFANFCNEQLQLEPETLLQAWAKPVLHEIEDLETIPDPPEVEPKELKEYEEAFRQAWEDMARLP